MLEFLVTKLFTALEKSTESKEVTHKQIRYCSQQNYSADIYEEALGRVDFANYHNLENINDAYSNFIQKVMGSLI